MSVDANQLCSDIIYKDIDQLKRGERDCASLPACRAETHIACVATENFPAIKIEGLGSLVVAGRTLAGVASDSTSLYECDDDLLTPCLADGIKRKIIRIDQIQASDIKEGVIFANVTGIFRGRPELCSQDGQIACVASADFPSIDKVQTLGGQRNKYHRSVTIGGISGLLDDCSIDGETSCVTRTDFPAIDKNLILNAFTLSRIHSSITIAGFPGTLTDCSVDGAVDCRADGSNFAAALATNLSAKIMAGQVLGGITGMVGSKPANCMFDGETGCVATPNFPAIDRDGNFSPLRLSKISASLNLAGVAGTLPNCSNDGESSCLILGPSFSALKVAGAGPKMLSGMTLGGISGIASARPIDCSTDGGTSCTTTEHYKAVDAALAPSKIISGHSLGALLGTAIARPEDCMSDAELGCVATLAYPALDAADAENKIIRGFPSFGFCKEKIPTLSKLRLARDAEDEAHIMQRWRIYLITPFSST